MPKLKPLFAASIDEASADRIDRERPHFRTEQIDRPSQHLLVRLTNNVMVRGCGASGNPRGSAELMLWPNREPVATGSPGRAGR
jgi:hypothetical protein